MTNPWLRNKLPQLRREFTATKPVKQCDGLYLRAQGQFEMFLNGEKVGDHFLDPAWTKFDKEAQYVAFDITGELRDGKNAVGVMLGNGYYHTPHGRYLKLLFSYGAPKMICKLQIEYADGTHRPSFPMINGVRAKVRSLFRVFTAVRITMHQPCSQGGPNPDSTTGNGRRPF